MAESRVPLSSEAQEAKELMQRELLRNMAKTMVSTAVEEERQRRVQELKQLQTDEDQDDSIRKNAYEQLMVVQEDLIRNMNLMKAKSEMEYEKSQREAEVKKAQVHAELIRKSAAKEVDRAMEEERDRRINNDKAEFDEKKEAREKLITVQEDLLKTLRKMKVDEEVRLEQERRVLEGKKHLVHEELFQCVSEKTANSLMENEQMRRTIDIGEEEIKRRIHIAKKLIDVQKELLATHKEVKGITGTASQEVLEEMKAFYQEQLLRKANQVEAISVMEEEKKRRINEEESHTVSDSQVIVLEEISRKSNIKVAKEQADSTQREYIQADTKARVLEDTVRKVNQKAADLAMDAEKEERMMADTTTKKPLDTAMKKEIESHSK